VPTEYLISGGLTLADLRQAATGFAKNELIGLEIVEFQAYWTCAACKVRRVES
jgi:arginase family enzyme